ncbi:MAG: 23S rRNA (guanosine(2251)-2'-O)-methyltransferase RlmB [Proteobacteria bacterium]|nr:23S rRNA (guanosine(2251)-2'-O)-methyltransferase RlmB [Pseudomonadota bacterium]
MANASIIYGVHAVMAALEHHPESLLTIYCETGEISARIKHLIEKANQHGIAIENMATTKLDKLTESTHHQGIAAKVKALAPKTEKDILTWLENTDKKPLLLILEGIQDPHNLGACLRSAEALGVDFVILPKDNSAPINALVSKISCGATLTLPVVVCANIVRFIEQIQKRDIWVVGTSGHAEIVLSQAALTRKVAIVMGTEDKGLKRLTIEACDEVVKIPLLGTVESLNVSVATGIALYEVLRQRS